VANACHFAGQLLAAQRNSAGRCSRRPRRFPGKGEYPAAKKGGSPCISACGHPPDRPGCRPLADVATISLLHERSMRHSDTLNEQLQTALNSRVIIEQAKGKLAERLGVDMDQAFSLLRDRARTSNRRLSDLARAFVDGTETLTGPATGTSQHRLPDTGQVPAS
jgi:hypothetical protein